MRLAAQGHSPASGGGETRLAPGLVGGKRTAEALTLTLPCDRPGARRVVKGL